jgi:hypothetical protein
VGALEGYDAPVARDRNSYDDLGSADDVPCNMYLRRELLADAQFYIARFILQGRSQYVYHMQLA